MRPGFVSIVAGAIAIAMIVTGFWIVQQAQDVAWDWGSSRPEVTMWAIRSGGIAAIALAQAILVVAVTSRVYRRGTLDSLLGLTSIAVFALACVSAIACGLAGR